MLMNILLIIVAAISVIISVYEWVDERDFGMSMLLLFGTAFLGLIIAIIIFFFLYAL